MEETKTYTPSELSILIRMDSFAFMIIDQSSIVSVYETIPFKTRHHHFRYVDPVDVLSIVQNNNLRYSRFEKVHISIDHDAFTYVPQELYDASAWHEYLGFVASGIKKDDVVNSSMVPGKCCVFQYPLPIRKLLSTLYPTSEIHHLSESLVEFLSREVGEDDALFVLMHGDALYVLVFEDRLLTLINRYHAPDVRDRLYYILLACKHRKLSPRKVNVKITGSKDAVEDLDQSLSRYFIHVHQIDWKNGWRLPLSVQNPMDIFEFYCMHHANRGR